MNDYGIETKSKKTFKSPIRKPLNTEDVKLNPIKKKYQ